MRRRKIDSKVERGLLIALIVSRDFLAQASVVLDLDLIDSGPFRTVAKWCLDYFKEYGNAPGRQIESLYHSWVEKSEEPGPETEAIHDLLEGLSNEYDAAGTINVQYHLDELGVYLKRKGLRKLRDDLEYSLHSGDEQEAEQTVLNYKVVEVGGGAGVDPFADPAVWERAFSDPALPVIEFPGDAGRFFNTALTRDALIGIQAPEKRGKTFWCLEFMFRALRTRKKVAMFQTGDLSEAQLVRRMGSYLSRRPSLKEFCGAIKMPTEIERPKDRKAHKDDGDEDDEDGGSKDKPKSRPLPPMKHHTIQADKPIRKGACIRACESFMRRNGLSLTHPFLRISVHANSSINVQGIEAILDRWDMQNNFIPDVVIIDYADILAPEDPKKDARWQINDTWKALRRLSQERHCLVIAPTQSTREGYEAEVQQMKHSSEDKRKLAHVTGMLGLNQTDEEKDAGVMRLNWVALRESPFNVKRCLWVGQCLALGRAFCCGAL